MEWFSVAEITFRAQSRSSATDNMTSY